LNRTQVGPFVLSDACTIDDFDSHESDRFVAPLDYPLVGYPVATLSHEQKNKLKAGQQLPICDIVMSSCLTETDRIQVESPHGFFAMAYIKDNLLCPERIFHT
jgi:tRNA U55 pseudouridine synthase TruB